MLHVTLQHLPRRAQDAAGWGDFGAPGPSKRVGWPEHLGYRVPVRAVAARKKEGAAAGHSLHLTKSPSDEAAIDARRIA